MAHFAFWSAAANFGLQLSAEQQINPRNELSLGPDLGLARSRSQSHPDQNRKSTTTTTVLMGCGCTAGSFALVVLGGLQKFPKRSSEKRRQIRRRPSYLVLLEVFRLTYPANLGMPQATNESELRVKLKPVFNSARGSVLKLALPDPLRPSRSFLRTRLCGPRMNALTCRI